ncbi:zinc cluster transcription factor, putative [Candida dubliniensis CD36]|uniref:Zinc cluster transcription factor, putative n=1 Tax=Candida dubliniensis (strain CD36 / ATCC MYA-646 / CBS 7987 / NCPF 3949 / NRRL Y-17841) TaxID=573826 RepID=B9WGM2_CANDC|nr:zinc cluster transcription factor, putative [Candida dubliniensis CD36]CAX42397.1 zinc cluster transcription factor, putative [Candida dubliniensis CD36]
MVETSESNSFSMSTNVTGIPNPNVQIIQDGKIVKKVQRTRQRKILSCVYCHSKKIKCDRQEPCSQCTKLDIECKYFINERISRGGKKSSRLTADEKKLRGLTSSAEESKKGQSKSDEATKSQDTQSSLSSCPTNSSTTTVTNPLATSSSLETNIEEVEQKHFVTVSDNKNFIENSNQTQREQLGIDDGAFKPSGLDMSASILTFPNKSETNSNLNSLRGFTTTLESPFSGADPFAMGSLIQSPMVNQATNNMTNSYFNHNFTTQTNNQISFNSSSFPLANQDVSITFPSHVNSPTMTFSERLQQQQQQQQQQSQQPQPRQQTPHRPESDSLMKTQTQNSSLYHSFNEYRVNTATSINYLYGTNTYGENSNILNDIMEYLPTGKDRSFELMDRYINSVHLLLPIVVNMNEFLAQHKLYWEIKSKRDSSSSDADANNPHVESYR